MPVSPTGCLALPLENLRQLLAHSAAWQTWTGAASAAAAANRVHLVAPADPDNGRAYSNAELDGMRPFAVLSVGPDFAVTRRGAGVYRVGGQVVLRIEAAVSDDYRDSERDAELDFLNRLGAVIGDMITADEGAGDLVPESVQMPAPPQRVGDESEPSEGAAFYADLWVSFAGV